ncbi:ABC-2 family transporter protein [compost metagenome]
MDRLTRFELKKIIRRKSFYASILIVVCTAIFLSVVLITNARITGKDGQFLHGIPAIHLEQNYNRELAGLLTVDKLKNTIERHQSLMRDPKNLDGNGEMTIKANGTFDVKDYQIHSLISYAFSPIGGYDFYIIDKMNPSDVNEFYQKRIGKVQEYLNTEYSYGDYSQEEKAYFKKMNEDISIPFQLDYVTGWKNVFENLPNLFLIIAFVIAVCLAPVFANEYQRRTDSIILSTRYGSNKLIIAKLKASFLVSAGFIILGLAIYTLLLLGIFGFDGDNASVQIIDFFAPVSFTVFQTYLWAIFIGSMACLLIGAVTLWLSSRLSSSFPVMITMGIVLIGPLLIPESKSSRFLNYVMDLLPANMFDAFNKITNYRLFHIFGQLIPEYQVLAVFPIIIIALVLPFAYWAFKTHQVF